jgi:hypothetical protein
MTEVTGMAGTDVASGGLLARLRLAESLMYRGRRWQALDVLQQARILDAPAVDRYALGEALLRASNARLGWDLYDLHPSRPADRLPGVPRWDGSWCERLVVLAEQGFGDALQFLRFVPRVIGRAGRIVVALHDELMPVAASSPMLAGTAVVSKSQAAATAWPSGTRWERLMSLPARIADAGAEPAQAYLNQPAARPGCVLPDAQPGCLTVGVAWRATRRHGFPSRSMPVQVLAPLAAGGRVRLVCLHRSGDVPTPPRFITGLDIRDFTDTASVMAQCDLIVSVDTVTAHLAAALGIRTLICLRHRPDWRWGTPANPTHWYHHARPLFQDGRRRWEPVIRAAAERLLADVRQTYT